MSKFTVRHGAQGAFYVDYGEWTGCFDGPGCDVATITVDDVALVAAYMAIYDATVSGTSFAAILAGARAAYTWMTGEEVLS